MAQDFILLATLGRTDVQVVLPIDGVPHRMSVAPASTRAFQDACVSGRIRWSMLPLDSGEEIAENKDLSLDYDTANARLMSRRTYHCNKVVEHDCTAPVTLCAPLLADTVGQINKLKGLGRPRGALLLNTRREPPDPKEPVGAAELVRAALAAALQLALDQVVECVFLTAGDLYESDVSGNRHLRSDAAKHIDKKLCEARERGLQQSKSLQAVISDVGGFPETKAVLAEAARYRFGNVRFVRPIEHRDSQPPPLVDARIPPAESFQIRRHVAALLCGGAWDAAAHLAKSCVTQEQLASEPWRARLNTVATTLRGQTPDTKDVSGRALAALRPIVGHGPVLLIAIRIEAALRRGAWVEALRELFTWLDASLISLGNRFLSRNAARPCIDLGTSLLRFDDASPDLQAALRKAGCGKRSIYMDGKAQHLLRQTLPDRPRLALQSFDDAIAAVRGFRNAATHGWLSDQNVRSARQSLEQSQVWRKDCPRFLKCPHAESIFCLAGIDDPAALYDALVKAMLGDMDDYSFCET